MRTITSEMFRNSADLTRLHYRQQARPIGPVNASDKLVWVATDTHDKVVRIGLVLKAVIRP